MQTQTFSPLQSDKVSLSDETPEEYTLVLPEGFRESFFPGTWRIRIFVVSLALLWGILMFVAGVSSGVRLGYSEGYAAPHPMSTEMLACDDWATHKNCRWSDGTPLPK